MHELSVTESLLKVALRHAHESGAKRVSDLYLVIGQLSSIVDDSVQFYWDMIAENTIAAGARLHFRRIRAEMLCCDCQQQYRLTGDFTCPLCGGANVRVVSGEEFYLEAIDIETGETVMEKGETQDDHPYPCS